MYICKILAEKVQMSDILQFLHGVQYCVWVKIPTY